MYTGADILQSNAGGCKRILNCRIVAAAGLDCILGWMSKEACCNELQYPISASNVSRHSYGRALVAFFILHSTPLVSGAKTVEPQTMYTGADMLQSKAGGRRRLLFRRPSETNQSSSCVFAALSLGL